MKCITCGQEIPDTSNICPFCNNKVEPVKTAAEILGATQTIPVTPNTYVLPIDQIKEATQRIPVQNVETTNIPAPPKMEESIPTPPKMDEVVNQEKSSEVLNNQTNTPTFINSQTLDVSNVDLNANPEFSPIDLTMTSSKDASTLAPKKEKSMSKKKLIILLIVVILILAIAGVGIWFYITQYTTADKRIDKAVDKLFAYTQSLNNSKIEKNSGSYKLSYSSSKNDDNLTISLDGKYGIDLPNKKIDLITNIKSYNHNQELLDKEMNVELYLENSRAYFLHQNYNNMYYYTEIADSEEVLKGIESRFNNPEELFLFNVINSLYANGLGDLSKNYSKYIDNISQNDINYMNIISGVKSSMKEMLKDASKTQEFKNGNNVVTIQISSPEAKKNMFKRYADTLKNNQKAYSEISKIYGGDTLYYKDLMDKIEHIDYPQTGNIIITTDAFKNTLKSIVLPIVIGDKVYNTKITPSNGGYKIVSRLDNKEVLNITYARSTSKTSTTETITRTIKGVVLEGDVANNLDITLEVVKDINPSKISVITRNSIDYAFLTPTDYEAYAAYLSEQGNFGVIFKSHYKGYTDPTLSEGVDPAIESPVVPNGEAVNG